MGELTSKGDPQRHESIQKEMFEKRFSESLKRNIEYAKDKKNSVKYPVDHVMGSVLQQIQSGLEVDAMIAAADSQLFQDPNSRMSKLKNRALSPEQARFAIQEATKFLLVSFGTAILPDIQDFWLVPQRTITHVEDGVEMEKLPGLETLLFTLGQGQGNAGEDIRWEPLTVLDIPKDLPEFSID